jgi:DNA-binding PadR family transcriptional regulator
LESEFLSKMNKRIVNDFIDIIILERLKNGPMSGYDVIEFIHKKFSYLISAGTVYAALHSMERDGLIEGYLNQKKRVYILTKKGEETLKAILNLKTKILGLMLNVFI